MFSRLTIWHCGWSALPFRRPRLALLALLSCLYSSVCRAEASWAFPHPVWHVSCCHPCSAHASDITGRQISQQTPGPSGSGDLSAALSSTMFPEPWVRKLCGRCVRWDRTPQLCILIDCGFSNGLRLWQREASLMTGELIGSLASWSGFIQGWCVECFSPQVDAGSG